MDYQNDKSILWQKNFNNAEREHLTGKIVIISLKDMPLETRRKEAKKPLFLDRYE
jgi:hypothetical protein